MDSQTRSKQALKHDKRSQLSLRMQRLENPCRHCVRLWVGDSSASSSGEKRLRPSTLRSLHELHPVSSSDLLKLKATLLD